MLIAVTGANGFVGRRLAIRLAQTGNQVVAFGRRPASHPDLQSVPLICYRVWDIALGASPDVPQSVDGVVHCAALASDWAPYAPMYATNVLGTRAVLETFAGVPRFVHMSTASVYDPLRPKHHVTEAALLPRKYLNAYAFTKMLAEREVEHSRRDAIILRPHAVYGPGDHALLPRLLSARRAGRLIAVGDGRNHVSVTHVDNLVHAVERALATEVTGCAILNIADAGAEILDTLLRVFLRAFGLPERITYLPTAVAWPLASALERAYQLAGARRAPPLTRYMVAQLASEYTLDTRKATRVLCYRPVHTYATGVWAAARDFDTSRTHHADCGRGA